MSTEVIERLRKSEAKAKQNAIDLAIAIVQGEAPPQAEVEKVCRDAGLTATLFAHAISTLSDRMAIADSFNRGEINAALKQAKAERDKAISDKDRAKKQVETAQEKIREARRREEEADHRVRQLDNRLQTEPNKIRFKLDETGDPDDWRGVTIPVGRNAGTLKQGRQRAVRDSTDIGWKPSVAESV